MRMIQTHQIKAVIVNKVNITPTPHIIQIIF